MGDYYLGEIRAFACDYAPEGWAICNGSLLLIQSNAALYTLIGIQYGGDGKVNFALPDLRGRVPIGTGVRGTYVYSAGNNGGSETVALGTTEMPAHNHPFFVKNTVGTVPIVGASLGLPNTSTVNLNTYNPNGSTKVTLNPDTIENTGGGAAHNNMQPFQVINFCIAINGLFPTRP